MDTIIQQLELSMKNDLKAIGQTIRTLCSSHKRYSETIFDFYKRNDDSLSLYFIGKCHHLKHNFRLALYYFGLSVEKGDMNSGYALNAIGNCFQEGLGVGKNKEEALEYFARSARLRNSYGMNSLATHYYLKKDYTRASLLWKNACEIGNNPSCFYKMGNCYSRGHGIQKDIDKAVANYNIASEMGCLESVKKLKQLNPSEIDRIRGLN